MQSIAKYDFRTFLALEASLIKRLMKDWQKRSVQYYEQIAQFCRDKQWDKARQLVPELDLYETGQRNKEYVKYALLSCAVYGAGRVSKKEKPYFVGIGAFDNTLNQVTSTILQYLEHKATKEVQLQALQLIAEDEQKSKIVVQKSNPYHAADGAFTDKEHAVSVFHGSSIENLASILTTGVLPNAQRLWSPDFYEGDRAKSVYLAEKEKSALEAAEDGFKNWHTTEEIEKLRGLVSFVVFKVRVPNETGLLEDEHAGPGYSRIVGSVKPDWIESYSTYRYEGGTYRPKLVLDKQVQVHKSDFRIMYVPVVLYDRVEKAEYKYGIVSITLEDELAGLCSAARDAIQDEDLGGKGKDPSNHVTVRYGLLDNDVDKLREYIARMSPFMIEAEDVMVFSVSEHSEGMCPVVVKISSPFLNGVHYEIEKHGSFVPDSFSTFNPHCTLAYVQPDKAYKYKDLKVSGKMLVDRMTISHSNGVEETIPFGITRKSNPYHDEQGQFTSKDKVILSHSESDVKNATMLYAETLSGGATVGKASSFYIKNDEEGLKEYIKSKDIDPENPGEHIGFLEYTKSAKVLVDSIRSAEESEVLLYRGVKDSKPIVSLESMKVGDTMSMGSITSFTEDPSQAAYYGAGKKSYSYQIVVRGKSKSVATDKFTGLGHRERITEGMFKVVEIKGPSKMKLPETYVGKADYRRTLVLEQTGVF